MELEIFDVKNRVSYTGKNAVTFRMRDGRIVTALKTKLGVYAVENELYLKQLEVRTTTNEFECLVWLRELTGEFLEDIMDAVDFYSGHKLFIEEKKKPSKDFKGYRLDKDVDYVKADLDAMTLFVGLLGGRK